MRPGERPLRALRERGVQYIEVRAMDLDPFSAIGIAAQTVRFLDIFLLHCLLSDSPPDTPREIAAIGHNKQRVAARGREPGLRLDHADGQRDLRQWASELLAQCRPVAAALDAAQGGNGHREALAMAIDMIANPDSVPSACALAEMRRHHGGSYFRFALERSRRHRLALSADPLPAGLEARFRNLAEGSLEEQRQLESGNDLPFEAYRQRYVSADSLRAG